MCESLYRRKFDVHTQTQFLSVMNNCDIRYRLLGQSHAFTQLVNITARHVEPKHFGYVELVEQHDLTRSPRRTRLARHARQNALVDTLETSNMSCPVET